MTNKEDKFRALLQNPLEKEKPKVMSAILTMDLNKEAQKSPYLAWRTAVHTWSGVKPLLISIRSPNQAEIFFDARHVSQISKLPPEVSDLGTTSILLPKDILRRAKMYLQGYYKDLRLATLAGFHPQNQLQVLATAESLLPSHFMHQTDQFRWQKTIWYDRNKL
jgi:hypothetical protein